jgi:hypothetical protein
MRSKAIIAGLAAGTMLLSLPAAAVAQSNNQAGPLAVILPVMAGLGQAPQAAAQPSPGPGQSPGAPDSVRARLAQIQARITAVLRAVSERVGLPFSP